MTILNQKTCSSFWIILLNALEEIKYACGGYEKSLGLKNFENYSSIDFLALEFTMWIVIL